MSDTDFDSITVQDLDTLGSIGRDALSFGVIGFDSATLVDAYNTTEAQMAGLDPNRVLGKHLFEAIAPCMNNFMVAQRFADEAELNATLPYVLTLRMRPTRVRLRLMAATGAPRRYILIER